MFGWMSSLFVLYFFQTTRITSTAMEVLVKYGLHLVGFALVSFFLVVRTDSCIRIPHYTAKYSERLSLLEPRFVIRVLVAVSHHLVQLQWLRPVSFQFPGYFSPVRLRADFLRVPPVAESSSTIWLKTHFKISAHTPEKLAPARLCCSASPAQRFRDKLMLPSQML